MNSLSSTPFSLIFETTSIAAFQVICVFLVSLFVIFCCIPPLHSPVRRLVRPFVVHHVEKGLSWVIYTQKYEMRWLTALFEHSSHSVSVAFYGSFLPGLMWLGFPELGWHLVILMTLTLTVGNAMKDLVSGPRPLGLRYGKARVKHLGHSSEEVEKNAKEYGFPSSHTMNSLCLNFYTCHYLHEHQIITDNIAMLAYAGVIAWVSWIALSRVYLGLHTPIDILAGAIAGLTVVTCFIAIEEPINLWVNNPNPLFVSISALLLSIIILRLHPKPMEHTPTFEFSTSFMGVMLGVVTAVSRSPHFYAPPIQIQFIMKHSAWWIARRLLAGFALVLISKEISRKISYALLPHVYLLFPTRLRKLWQPPVHNQCDIDKIPDPRLNMLPHSIQCRPCDVEATSRYFAYFGIGYIAAGGAPRMFDYMNW